jgi:hypothetical protein
VRDRLFVVPSAAAAGLCVRRPGQGTSLQSGQTTIAGQQVACVNPAALAGRTAELDPCLLTATRTIQYPGCSGRLAERVSAPWVTTWLQVTSLAGTSHSRPVVTDNTAGNLGGTGPA